MLQLLSILVSSAAKGTNRPFSCLKHPQPAPEFASSEETSVTPLQSLQPYGIYINPVLSNSIGASQVCYEFSPLLLAK